MFQQLQRIIASCLLGLLCASCTPVSIPPPSAAPTAPKENSGAKVDSTADAFGNDTAPAPTITPEKNVPERLLPTGLLEIGDTAAPLTVLMFTEHHCSYCRDFDTDEFPSLRQEFIESGKVKLQIAILPLKKYLDSDLSALALICGSEQSKGVAINNALFKLEAHDAATLADTAASLGLDKGKFASCLKKDATKAMLESERSLAASLDVTLVPTLFINGEKSVGLPYYEDLRGAIEKAFTGN